MNLKMDFHPSKVKVLMLVVAAGATVLSVSAQQGGQPIIFSSPQNSDAQAIAPSTASASLQPGILPGTMPAPVQIFDLSPPSDFKPSPATVSPQQQRMRKLLEDRKNWALMTPEEILGTTPDKMLQPPERDALGRENNQTQIERYLQRENNLRNGLTNGWQNDRANSSWNFLRDQDKANPLNPGRDNTTTARSLSQLLNGQRNGNDSENQNGNSRWDMFSQPLPQAAPKPDPEQVAAMERFRQLLSPSPAPVANTSPNNSFFSTPKPVLDPFITQPDFVPNPAGASFTPLSSGIGRPTGLAPLPGTVTTFSLPVAAPAWKPQRPPWLLQGPQPFVMPQTKGY